MITPQGGLDMSNGLRAHHGFAINLAIKFIVRNVVKGGRDGKMCDVKSHVRSHMESHIKCHAMKVNISGRVEMRGVM